MLIRAFVMAGLLGAYALWGWIVPVAIIGAAGAWHIWYRVHYGRWPPLD